MGKKSRTPEQRAVEYPAQKVTVDRLTLRQRQVIGTVLAEMGASQLVEKGNPEPELQLMREGADVLRWLLSRYADEVGL